MLITRFALVLALSIFVIHLLQSQPMFEAMLRSSIVFVMLAIGGHIGLYLFRWIGNSRQVENNESNDMQTDTQEAREA